MLCNFDEKCTRKKCNFSHSVPKTQLEAQPICQYFNSKAGCKDGNTCTSRHVVLSGAKGRSTSKGESLRQSKVSKIAKPSTKAKSQSICQYFNTKRGCDRGQSCSYLHVAKEELALTPALDYATYVEQSHMLLGTAVLLDGGSLIISSKAANPKWEAFARYRSPKINFRQGILFAHAFVDAISMKSVDDVIITLASNPQIISVLTAMPVTLDAESANHPRLSFLSCIVPFVSCLAHVKVSKSPMTDYVSTIYAAVRKNFDVFFPSYLTACQELLDHQAVTFLNLTMDQAMASGSAPTFPVSFIPIYLSIVRLLNGLISFNKRFKYDDVVLNGTEKLQHQILVLSGLDSIKHNEKFGLRVLEQEFAVTVRISNEARQQLKRGLLKSAELEVRSLVRAAVNNPWSNLTLIAPGKDTDREAQHNNDFLDFRKIRILPTREELMSKDDPRLPGNYMEIDAASWLPQGPERLLDTHFRLLREDLLAPLRNSIQGYLLYLQRPKDFKVTLDKGRLRGSMIKGGTSIDLLIHSNAKLSGISIPKSNQVCSDILFDTPVSSNYEGFWKGRLLFGNMVALAVRKKTGSYEIIFGHVGFRDEKALCTSSPRIGITIDAKYLTSEVVHSLTRKYSQEKSPNFIIENAILFESYRAILTSLQKIDSTELPFAKYLCYPSGVNTVVDCPIYTMVPNFSLNLRSILRLKDDLRLDPNDEASKAHCLERLKIDSTLDQDQAQALIHALCREMTCILGPPGTGKSYCGEKIVEVLVDNKSIVSPNSPIMLLCFTNHALDQFLTALLDMGVSKIVRIGGRSKSERMEKINLRTLDISKSRSQRYGERQCWLKIDELRSQIEKFNCQIGSRHVPYWKLKDYLLVNYYELSVYFENHMTNIRAEYEEGFQVHGVKEETLEEDVFKLVQSSLL